MKGKYYRVLDAGTSASGAVLEENDASSDGEPSSNNDLISNMDESAEAVCEPVSNENCVVDAPSPENNVDNTEQDVNVCEDVEVGASVLGEEDFNPYADRSQVNEESYASKAARTEGLRNNSRETPRRRGHMSSVDSLPNRPRSAFFTPSRHVGARNVFDVLKAADIPANEVACLQKRMNGEVVITFNRTAMKEKFLRLNSLRIGSENYAVQDIDTPLTFLTIYDAPFELSDLAIIRRLLPYCEVLHYRRGRFDFCNTYNGLRHYRVRVIKPIPSFLRFGSHQIFLKHSGQVATCRRCNREGHFGQQCTTKVCFNCEALGHEARDCPAPILCCICKSIWHLSKACPYSWYVPSSRPQATDESANVDVDDSASRPCDADGDQHDAGSPDQCGNADADDDADNVDGDDDADDTSINTAELASDFGEEMSESEDPAATDEVPASADSHDDASQHTAPDVSDSVLNSQGLIKDPAPPAANVQRADMSASESPINEVPASEDVSPSTPASGDVSVAASEPIPSDVPADVKKGDSRSGAAPVPKRLSGRRAPAPLPEPLKVFQRKKTAPVVVSSTPKSCPPTGPSAMDTSVSLKRKDSPLPPRVKKPVRKKKYT